MKFQDLSNERLLEAYKVLSGKRLQGSFGCFWGVKVPEKMTDDLLSDLPFIELIYSYSRGSYSLEGSRSCEGVTSERTSKDDEISKLKILGIYKPNTG